MVEYVAANICRHKTAGIQYYGQQCSISLQNGEIFFFCCTFYAIQHPGHPGAGEFQITCACFPNFEKFETFYCDFIFCKILLTNKYLRVNTSHASVYVG